MPQLSRVYGRSATDAAASSRARLTPTPVAARLRGPCEYIRTHGVPRSTVARRLGWHGQQVVMVHGHLQPPGGRSGEPLLDVPARRCGELGSLLTGRTNPA